MSQSVIRMTYRIETSGDVAALATKIASDQSTGTFVPTPGETPELKARVGARVVEVRKLESVPTPSFPETNPSRDGPYWRGEADIEFPLEAVGTDLAALMTIAIGGVFSIKGFSGIRIVDMKLPPEYAQAHPGPQFGIAGSRALTGVKERPIIGTIVKPSLGLRPHETAEMVRELADADVDFIKDDEKLMSPAYSSLADRVKAIMPILLDREQKTGKKVMYAFGISHADPEVMQRNHDIVADAGGNAAVVNINSIGYGGFSFLRKRSRLVLHAHRNGWDILTRHPGPWPGFSSLSAILATAGRRPVPNQRHRREILGARRFLRAVVPRASGAAVLAERSTAAGVRIRPMGRSGAGDIRTDRPHTGSTVSLRRRRRQPSWRPCLGRARRQTSVGGGGRGHSARDLRPRSS